MTLTQTRTAGEVSAAEAGAIAIEAYTYLYPLVTMDVTRRQMISLPAGVRPGYGPEGSISHMRAFPPAGFKVVVRPNFDTLYSSAWIDLSTGPALLTLPEAGDRYYLAPLYDMWTDAFAVPGTRTSGGGGGRFAIVPPGWQGELPEGVVRIDAPTSRVWMIGRVQTNGPADYEAVHAFQDGIAIEPLVAGREAELPATQDFGPAVDLATPPLDAVNGMAGADYFAYGAALMRRYPPHLTDWSILARMRRIGLEAGKPFDVESAPDVVRDAIAAAPAAALGVMHARFQTLGTMVNGWNISAETMGVYGDAYTRRAVIAMVGLGANQPRDAIYPVLVHDADGRPLDGGTDYVIHFAADALPPVDAFWSVTMYDAEGFHAANELDRFAIGDRDPLVYNADGSLDIWISHANPGPAKAANWLPAPLGPLGITMRLYAPRPAALSGAWAPPPVSRLAS